nr:hypothetical protein [uncultured Pedobacter sp.]
MYQISINSNFQQPIRSRKRRSGSTSGKKENSTLKPVGNGFLNHSFHTISPLPPILMDRAKVETSLENNIKNFNATFTAEISLSKTSTYPQNINLALNDIKSFLLSQSDNYVVKLVEHKNGVAIEVQKEISINNTLYFIDISPYYRLKENKNFSTANLLMSVFSYLFQVCKLDHYQHSFIGGIYESWSEMEPDEEDAVSEIIPDALLNQKDFRTRAVNFKNLLSFERRVANYQPTNDKEKSFQEVANSFLCFYRQYGNFNIFNTIVHPEDVDDDCNVLTPDEYMSFCYGWTVEPHGEELMYIVNDHLQEKSEIALPCEDALLFDQPHTGINNFNTLYVKQYFRLLNNLAETLENL